VDKIVKISVRLTQNTPNPKLVVENLRNKTECTYRTYLSRQIYYI